MVESSIPGSSIGWSKQRFVYENITCKSRIISNIIAYFTHPIQTTVYKILHIVAFVMLNKVFALSLKSDSVGCGMNNIAYHDF